MSQIVTSWLNLEIKMPRNVVFRLTHKVKMFKAKIHAAKISRLKVSNHQQEFVGLCLHIEHREMRDCWLAGKKYGGQLRSSLLD